MPKELKNLLSLHIKLDDSWQMVLLSKWDTIIGNLATKVRLEKIQDDTLLLGVYDACWMQELYLLSPLLINTINQNLDQPRIKHLRFKRSVAQKKGKLKAAQAAAQPMPALQLKPHEAAALEKIKDPHLRIALQDFLKRCYSEKV